MPNRAGYTQDRYIQRYARMLAPSDDSFIAYNPLACPVLDVDDPKGNFVDVSGGFADESSFDEMVMADGQERPSRIKMRVSEVDGYTLQQHAKGINLTEFSQRIGMTGLDLRRAAAGLLMKHVKIVRERVLANLVFNTTTFSGFTAAVGTQWDAGGSDPVADALTAQENVISASGEKPNTLIVGHEVYKALRQNDAIRELWSRTANTGGFIPDSALAGILDVDRVIVGRAVSNTAAEGLTESKSFIWGKYALFCHISQEPTPFTPQSCIQRFRMRGAAEPGIREYLLPGGYVEQMDAVYEEQFTVPTPDLGYLWSSVVS